MSKKNPYTFKLNKTTILILAGFALEVVAGVIKLPNTYIRNGLIILGVALIFISMLEVKKNSPFVEAKESEIADDIGFDFNGHFRDYKNVLSNKEGSIKYSTWRDGLLKKYNRYGQTEPKKKQITEDIRFYLKESRRKAEEKSDTVKSIMVPAEFGIVASVYELDIGPITDEMALIVVMVMTAALVILCGVEIGQCNRIRKFIDDFSEVLDIPLGKE